MAPDLINGCFEALGSLLILNHCRVTLRDRGVKGVSLLSTGIFNAWGVWNLFYYPALGQWWSFWGGCGLSLANACWVVLMVRFR